MGVAGTVWLFLVIDIYLCVEAASWYRKGELPTVMCSVKTYTYNTSADNKHWGLLYVFTCDITYRYHVLTDLCSVHSHVNTQASYRHDILTSTYRLLTSQYHNVLIKEFS